MHLFWQTPLFTRDELNGAGVKLILYPLSAFRAMSFAALAVYRAIVNEGTQQSMINNMQTRDDLYDVLKYREFERKLDLFMEEHDG
jgi:methylisocitrate lyase